MSTIKIKGNSKTYDEAAGANVKINGSANTVDMADGGSVDIVAGGSDHIDMSNGSLTLAAGTTGNLTGSVDGVNGAASDSLIVAGSNDAITMGTGGYVKISSGNGDAVSVNDGNVVTGSGVTNYSVNGSGNTLTAGAGNSVDIAGSSDSLYMTSGDAVTILSGTNEAMSLSDGTLTMDASGSDVLLAGSDDNITGVSSDQINVNGSNDDITVDGSAYVGILGGNDDIINMNGGSIATAGTVTNLLINGSDNIIGGGIDGSLNVNGSGNAISTQSPGYVGILAGDSDVVAMSNQSIDLASGVTNAYITGSGDVIAVSAGDNVIVTGTSDSIYAAEGSTIILSASDSGDTINLIGGSIVVGAGVTNITIVGTGDQFSGAGASLVGAITTTVTENVGPGGTLEPETVTTVPAVVYNAGDIQDIVNYFVANPNLSMDQIAAVESDSNYDTNLAEYLNSANISAMPANLLAMLDGYSSLYVALMGVPTATLKEEDEIDQDFAWGSTNAQVPSDGMSTMLQNLLPALLDTNVSTEQDVSDALECLANAQANPSPDNIIVMDTAAKLLFEMAEQPDNAKSAPLTDPYQVTLPGLTGPYEVAVQPTLPFGDSGTNELVYIKNEDGGFWGEFWNDLNSYVAPIVDAAAAVTGNFEIILAASALDAVQGGEDFASGQDLQGVFNVVAAVGGALNAIGQSAEQAEEAGGAEVLDSTSQAEVAIGSDLANGVGLAEGIDGIVNGAQTGNALAIITSALGGASGIAGLGRDSTLQQYASVGASLGASAEQLGSGNILAGLASLVEAAQTSGAPSEIGGGIASLLAAFNAGESGAAAGPTLLDAYIDALLAGAAAGEGADTSGGIQVASNGTVVAGGAVTVDVTTSGFGTTAAQEVGICSTLGLSGETDASVNGVNAADCLAYVDDPGDNTIDALFQNNEAQVPLTPQQAMEAFTYQAEGGNYLTGYVPNSNSGITIGEGIDLGQLSGPQDLINMGVPAQVADKIPANFFGAKGQNALTLLGQVGYGKANFNSTFELSEADVDTMNSDVQQYFLTRAQADYASQIPVLGWNEIPTDTKVAIAYSMFHNGETATTNSVFYDQLLNGNFLGAVENTQFWTGNPDAPSLVEIGIGQLILNDFMANGSILPTVQPLGQATGP